MGNASLDGGDGGASLDGNSPFILFIPSIPFVPSILLIPCEAHLTFHFSLFTFHLSPSIWLGLLSKDKVYCQDQAAEAGEVVPLEGVALDKQNGKEREDHQRDNLLDNLELPECEWTAEALPSVSSFRLSLPPPNKKGND